MKVGDKLICKEPLISYKYHKRYAESIIFCHRNTVVYIKNILPNNKIIVKTKSGEELETTYSKHLFYTKKEIRKFKLEKLNEQ